MYFFVDWALRAQTYSSPLTGVFCSIGLKEDICSTAHNQQLLVQLQKSHKLEEAMGLGFHSEPEKPQAGIRNLAGKCRFCGTSSWPENSNLVRNSSFFYYSFLSYNSTFLQCTIYDLLSISAVQHSTLRLHHYIVTRNL